MSQIAMSHFSVASMASVVVNDSVEYVGEYVDSSGFRSLCCLLPSAQDLPFIVPQHFSLVIRFTASRVFFFCNGVIRVESCGQKASRPGIIN